jgi:hypothetical protein
LSDEAARPHPPTPVFTRRRLRSKDHRRLNFREPLHADGVDLRDPVIEGCALDLILHLAIPESAFQGDELPLLESFGELREISPGEDAMPFGASFVVAFVVLPDLLGCDVEDDVLFIVLSSSGFCVLTEAADEDDFVDYVELGWFCQCDFVKQSKALLFLETPGVHRRAKASLDAGRRETSKWSIHP